MGYEATYTVHIHDRPSLLTAGSVQNHAVGSYVPKHDLRLIQLLDPSLQYEKHLLCVEAAAH